MTEYLRRATIVPDLLGPDLWENDLRVAAYMDRFKNKLASDFSSRQQDELISIILPTQNRTTALANAIVSVLLQSYENWELIIVDENSDDDTESLVAGFDEPRIKYIRNPEKGGFGRARNLGIELSSGTALAYLEDHSQWDPDCLLILLNQMRGCGARASYAAHVIWDDFDPDARLGRAFKSIRFSPFNRSLLENTNYISLTALVHERSLLDETGLFDASLKSHEEWDLILRLTEADRPAATPCALSHVFVQRPVEILNAEQSVPVAECAPTNVATRATALTATSIEPAPENGNIPSDDEEKLRLAEMRTKFSDRSDWSQPFLTSDGSEHLAFSLGRRARESRRKKLSKLPSNPVQILIPNYESLNELEMCLRSIGEHTPTPYHVLVIDNGSSEETYAELEKLPSSFENVRIIQMNDVSGFTFAVNRGLAEIAGKEEQVLILNNDTLVTPDWLDELRYVLFKHQDAGMAVPRQVLPANTKAARVHMPSATSAFECDVNLSVQHDNVIDPEFDPEDGLVELCYAPLFCGLVRPETINALGLLDSGNGPHYRSDWIFCDSMRRFLNQRIIYTPHSKIYHLQGVATRTKKSSEQALIHATDASPTVVGTETQPVGAAPE